MAGQATATPSAGGSDTSPTALARDLLVACKRGDSTASLRATLAALDDSALRPLREDRRTALAFWLNCYNAGTQLLLGERPELYDSPLGFVRFFWAPAITVAGTSLSLDRIENGLLRGGRSKYGLGYLPKLLVSTFEQRYRLSGCDPRVHFALNCGAESCPAIRAYEPEQIDRQLDLATRSYLEATVAYDADENLVRVPRVCLWFRGDFGGASGIRAFLREYDAIPADSTPKIRYLSWDWTKATGKFVE
ncbi:DUF547 domain-containing protein [Haloarcula sp. 1CSR25-25]|uniref:DUF547 domain-containing protein n=1 Tax=Haloarcula sp. 1CSR25-25 TaxID=2862545 RepID=UPI002893C374|nr:DUF547 domain-containing protein [Haloarcula sp. 1CSR25-25]MDT3437271.1 DUF547 domain-containing protein [Haloarcula sp. 1CSR25-25]